MARCLFTPLSPTHHHWCRYLRKDGTLWAACGFSLAANLFTARARLSRSAAGHGTSVAYSASHLTYFLCHAGFRYRVCALRLSASSC